MKIAIIAAMTETDRVIGDKGKIPWGRSMKDDLKRFKELTSGHTVIMGRRTFTDDLEGKPLPNRRNIVLSRNTSFEAVGCDVAHSFVQALSMIETQPNSKEETAFVIGGAEIYKEALAYADELHLSFIATKLKGDTIFPEVNFNRDWEGIALDYYEESPISGSGDKYPSWRGVWKRKSKTTPARVQVVDPKNAQSERYRETLVEITETGECPAPFCKKAADYHTNPVEVDWQYWKATQNSFNYQGARVKMLLVHKEHVENFSEVSAEAWKELQRLINYLVSKHAIKGATLLWRFGDSAYTGSSVTHLHAHLISGFDRTLAGEPIKTIVGFCLPKED